MAHFFTVHSISAFTLAQFTESLTRSHLFSIPMWLLCLWHKDKTIAPLWSTTLNGAWYEQLPSLPHCLNMPSKHLVPLNTLLKLLGKFCVINLLASLSVPVFVLDVKYSDMFCLLLLMATLSYLHSSPLCVLQFRTPVGFVVWELNFLPIHWPSTTLHVIISMPSILCLASPMVLGHDLVLQRAYIWQVYLCA